MVEEEDGEEAIETEDHGDMIMIETGIVVTGTVGIDHHPIIIMMDGIITITIHILILTTTHILTIITAIIHTIMTAIITIDPVSPFHGDFNRKLNS